MQITPTDIRAWRVCTPAPCVAFLNLTKTKVRPEFFSFDKPAGAQDHSPS